MQLIAKTSSSVAVDSDLTILIDWIAVKDFGDISVVVENAGGGSANSITDIQIDTSSDAGLTESLDQFAGQPGVPVINSVTKIATIDCEADYIRVRALCATDEDTTANAYVMATVGVDSLCTLMDVKGRLVIDGAESDEMILRIIKGVEAIFNNYCNRVLLQDNSDATEYYTGCHHLLQLKKYPVISITSITESYDYTYDFDNGTVLVENADYRLLDSGRKGMINRIIAQWPSHAEGIQIIYRGGYCPAGSTPGTGEIEVPNDLREAAIEQTCLIYKRRDDIGLSSQSFDGGSYNNFASLKLLPLVEETLKAYKRNVYA